VKAAGIPPDKRRGEEGIGQGIKGMSGWDVGEMQLTDGLVRITTSVWTDRMRGSSSKLGIHVVTRIV
jgi:hypothetical protein